MKTEIEKKENEFQKRKLKRKINENTGVNMKRAIMKINEWTM